MKKGEQEEIIRGTLMVFEELPNKAQEKLIFELMLSRKRFLELHPQYSATCDRDDTTLIDLKNMRIVGSGICPHCHGWIGRNDDYLNDPQ